MRARYPRPLDVKHLRPASGRTSPSRTEAVTTRSRSASLPVQERGEDVDQLPGRLLGDEVTAADPGDRELHRPLAPDLGRVVELRLVTTGGDEQRDGDTAARGPIVGVVPAVEVEARPVVGAH